MSEQRVSEELPKRGLIVIRGGYMSLGQMDQLRHETGLTILHLADGMDIDILDLDEMRRLGWMPVPEEVTT